MDAQTHQLDVSRLVIFVVGDMTDHTRKPYLTRNHTLTSLY